MSYAYTPGLKVKSATLVRKQRLLPIPGEVITQEHTRVAYNDVVARTHVPGEITTIPLAHLLGVEPNELPRTMLKKEGDTVNKGELLAVSKSFFGVFKTEYTSEATGTIELISKVSGMVGIQEHPVPLNLTAYISGKVIEVLPRQGAIIETIASYVQGIFGVGGEKHGEILIIAGPDESLTASHIGDDGKHKVLVGGSHITADGLKKAADVGAHGIVTGCIDRTDLDQLLGYEMGVAITGHEDIPFTCIITEGFYEVPMAHHTYEVLKSCEGKLASINGATQIRAGVIRPEIVVPVTESEMDKFTEDELLPGGMTIGTRVRVIRQPYFGAIGTVDYLPPKLQQLESESWVRVMNVKLDTGRVIKIPRANAEIIEQ